MARTTTTLESVIRRDRIFVLVGLFVLTALAWAYTVYMAFRMQGGSGSAMDPSMGSAMNQSMSMPMTGSWTGLEFGAMYVMWAVMMVAMMVPTAAPMILTFGLVARSRKEQQRPYTPTGVFVAGYIVAWGVFALLATFAQWGLHAATLISPMMVTTSTVFGGTLLIAAGLFQWSALKNVCLTHCRTPLGFLTAEWREGTSGALTMGIRHGIYCLGCCWVLMSLFFVLGVMNLVWIAALAAFILMEKVVPRQAQLSRASGVVLVGWGAWSILSGLL